MKVKHCITEESLDIDESTTIYVQRRNLDIVTPKADDFDKIKLKDAVKGEVVQTYLFSEGTDKVPEIYRIM